MDISLLGDQTSAEPPKYRTLSRSPPSTESPLALATKSLLVEEGRNAVVLLKGKRLCICLYSYIPSTILGDFYTLVYRTSLNDEPRLEPSPTHNRQCHHGNMGSTERLTAHSLINPMTCSEIVSAGLLAYV